MWNPILSIFSADVWSAKFTSAITLVELGFTFGNVPVRVLRDPKQSKKNL